MKFKVGDKVKFNKGNEVVAESYDYNPKKTYEVIETMEETSTVRIINELGKKLTFSEWRFDLYKPKPTKNQRITALEKEVSELKTIVHQLRESNITIDDVKRHFNITMAEAVERLSSTDVVVEDKPKTANELRGEIIEKAKRFIEEHSKGTDIVVNDEYQAVTAIYYDGKDVKKASALCHPNDVYNENIGKAIALGRALGLDVSEFEQAVQPTVAAGQIVSLKTNEQKKYHVTSVKARRENAFNLKRIDCDSGGWDDAENLTITNDTNAIYGGVE